MLEPLCAGVVNMTVEMYMVGWFDSWTTFVGVLDVGCRMSVMRNYRSDSSKENMNKQTDGE